MRQFFLDEQDSKTQIAKEATINPQLDYSRTILIDPVTDDFIEYLKTGLMEIQVWGQKPTDDEKYDNVHTACLGASLC